jgi:hypothetical protein
VAEWRLYHPAGGFTDGGLRSRQFCQAIYRTPVVLRIYLIAYFYVLIGFKQALPLLLFGYAPMCGAPFVLSTFFFESMAYFVSGHGGLPINGETTQVPSGVNFFLYCHRGEVLQNAIAWPIYTALLAGNIPGGACGAGGVCQQFFPDATMPNYVCWNYPQIAEASGVFNVGAITANNPVVSLAGYTEANPLKLSDLFALLANAPGGAGDIHWVACAS